jgi:hypothetical protein
MLNCARILLGSASNVVQTGTQHQTQMPDNKTMRAATLTAQTLNGTIISAVRWSYGVGGVFDD